ncbi:AfsR/SARP family transcriptional regulator [Streptomyces sp. NBC_01465]|uniref:AfsR/SARP family transcriptional regulator n=1 Tax=Streptomyces sp. NBC_01465 TaxID=2903878 RepID=UPI002E303719|nr:bacterial transcriptional activator domain-containing protein [Streptomyces sp. NBC_01465]
MAQPVFRLLGRVGVRDGESGRYAAPAGRKPRALLAVLLLRAGQRVPAGALTESLWEGEPPRSAPANLRSYISRLRQALPPGAELTGDSAGYLLHLATPEDCDRAVFLSRAAEARALAQSEGAGAATGADLDRAAVEYTAALRLWSGERAAEDVERHGGLLTAGLDALDAERLRAAEELAALLLRLGRPLAALAEAQQVLEADPLRVGGWSVRLGAHHALGERGQILHAYREARAAFRTGLDCEPDPELRRLYSELTDAA